MRRAEHPRSIESLRRVVLEAGAEGAPVCIAGGHHAMGDQQFVQDAVLVDMTGMNRVLDFDRERGVVEVDAGICWPELVARLASAREGGWPRWGIRQKQTGADRWSRIALLPVVSTVISSSPSIRSRTTSACASIARSGTVGAIS